MPLLLLRYPETTVRSPERGASRAPAGVPKPRVRIGWHLAGAHGSRPDPGSAIRSDRGKPSRPGAPAKVKVQDPDSGRRPVALPQSDAQKPESRVRRAPQGGPGERGQPAGSRVRPPEARPRQQREGRDPGSKVRLSGEGAARGRIQRGREGEPGLRGSLVLMKTPRKQALSVRPERRISHHSHTVRLCHLGAGGGTCRTPLSCDVR